MPLAPPTLTSPPRIVLDTNVLLDWLVFRNPEIAPVTEAVVAGRLTWIVTAAMRLELERVLTYSAVAARQPDLGAIATSWDTHAVVLPTAARAPLRCRDEDDQKFIDLAVEARAHWLLTKDHDLLRLAKRARPWGVNVMPTAAWPGAANTATAPTTVSA